MPTSAADPRCVRLTAARAAVLLAFLLAPSSALTIPPSDADAAPGSAGAPADSPIRCEVSLERGVYTPSERIAARFMLTNASDQPVEIELPISDDCLGLPAAFVLGTRDEPHLYYTYEGHDLEPAAGSPFVAATSPVDHRTIRLAPRAALGSEFDLRTLHRQFRYSGSFRLEWRPLGALTEPATAEFRIEPRKHAVLITDFGKVMFELRYDATPRNVENFLSLVRARFYDGLTIHRLIPDYLLQGGSPDGTGGGRRPDGATIAGEFDNAPFDLGTLAMARRPDQPDSASCQFFVSLARLPELDGQYTVVGQARDDESLRTLRQLAALPTDAAGRPLRPLVIRFFTLLDAEVPRSTELETAPVTTPETTSASATPPPASQPDQPGTLVPVKP